MHNRTAAVPKHWYYCRTLLGLLQQLPWDRPCPSHFSWAAHSAAAAGAMGEPEGWERMQTVASSWNWTPLEFHFSPHIYFFPISHKATNSLQNTCRNASKALITQLFLTLFKVPKRKHASINPRISKMTSYGSFWNQQHFSNPIHHSWMGWWKPTGLQTGCAGGAGGTRLAAAHCTALPHVPMLRAMPFHRALRPRPQKHNKLHSTLTVFELLWLEGSRLKFLLNYLLRNPVALRPLCLLFEAEEEPNENRSHNHQKEIGEHLRNFHNRKALLHPPLLPQAPMLQPGTPAALPEPRPTPGSAPASNRIAQRWLQVLQRKQHSPTESLTKGTTFHFLQIDNFEMDSLKLYHFFTS